MTSAGIIATPAAGSPAPITRQYFYGQNLGQASNADQTTWTRHLALDFTPDAGAEYVVFWTCEFNALTSDPLFQYAQVRLQQDGSTVDTLAMEPAVSGEDDWLAGNGVHFIAADSPPGSVSLTIDFRRTSGIFPDAVVVIRNARIVVLRLETADKFAASLAQQTTTLATFTDALTLSFTPASPGAYLVLGFGIVNAGIGRTIDVRLYDGSLGTPDLTSASPSGNARIGIVQAWVRPGLSGPQSFTLQYRSAAAGQTTGVTGARFLALRLDGFTHGFTANLIGDTAGGGSTFAEALGLSRTIQAKEFLTLAAYALSASGNFVESEIADPTGVVNAMIAGTGLGAYAHGFTATVGAYAAGRRDWSIRTSGPGGGTPGSTLVDNAVIAALQLN